MNDKKKYEVEWSFSFEKIGERISEMVDSVSEEPKTTTVCEQRGNAQTLEFHLHASIGRTTVDASANPDCLVDGTLVHTGEIDFSATGDENRVVKLSQKTQNQVRQAIGSITRRVDLHWQLGLSAGIPTRLFVHGGVGPAKLDLSAIDLTEFKLQGGVGETKILLPAKNFNASLHGGVGQNTLFVPSNATIHLRVDGGVGQTTVHVEPNTAVRITAQGGLGAVSVPRTFKQIKKSQDFMSQGGIWESEGFALAGNQVTIEYKGGVGALSLVQDDVTYM